MMRLITNLFFLFIITTNISFANLDCGNESIGKELNNTFDIKWTKDKIREICGEPTEIKNWDEEFYNEVNGQYAKNITSKSLWVYNQGSHTLIAYLLFRNDVLIDLKEDGYGGVNSDS